MCSGAWAGKSSWTRTTVSVDFGEFMVCAMMHDNCVDGLFVLIFIRLFEFCCQIDLNLATLLDSWGDGVQL